MPQQRIVDMSHADVVRVLQHPYRNMYFNDFDGAESKAAFDVVRAQGLRIRRACGAPVRPRAQCVASGPCGGVRDGGPPSERGAGPPLCLALLRLPGRRSATVMRHG